MADYVSREVARERLRKACKAGTILSVIMLLLGLLYGGVAAIIGLEVAVPGFVTNALYVLVPTMGDRILAAADCGTKGFLIALSGLLGILMFHKISRTGEAFRAGQLKQLKFIAFLLMLLGFLPTVVGNAVKVALAVQSGSAPLAVLSFAVEPMCILAGLFVFMALRAQVAGSHLVREEGELMATDPVANAPEPSFAGVPDLGNVTTAVPVSDATVASPSVTPYGYDVESTGEQPPTYQEY